MLTENMIEKILDEAVTRGADFAEVFEENSLFEETVATQEKVEQSVQGRESGVGIRIFKGLNCYYGYTNRKTEESLKELTKRLTKAMRQKEASKIILGEKNIYTMAPTVLMPSGLSFSRKMEPVQTAIRAGMDYDEEIVRMRVKLTDMEQQIQIANSEGLFAEDTRVKTRLYIGAFAQNGTDVQNGYFGPGAMQGHEYYDKIDVEACAREAARQAKVVLHSEPCPGGRMSVVVDNGFGGLLFHEACGHSLEATVIAKNSSEFCGKLGKKVASDVVTLIDDGSIEGEWGSLHIDDEGAPTQKNILIENGILKSYMVDRLNGMRAGLAPTGSSRRQNYKYAPVARMTNTYIAPGKSTPEEIIAATERGLYVKSIIGGSVESATGDFNFSTGECYLIENGKVTTPVRGATLIGNGGTVLQNVDMVAGDYDLRQGYCYASSGALFIGAGQPTIRVSNMTVGGIR